jgi:hypothetical protein
MGLDSQLADLPVGQIRLNCFNKSGRRAHELSATPSKNGCRIFRLAQIGPLAERLGHVAETVQRRLSINEDAGVEEGAQRSVSLGRKCPVAEGQTLKCGLHGQINSSRVAFA